MIENIVEVLAMEADKLVGSGGARPFDVHLRAIETRNLILARKPDLLFSADLGKEIISEYEATCAQNDEIGPAVMMMLKLHPIAVGRDFNARRRQEHAIMLLTRTGRLSGGVTVDYFQRYGLRLDVMREFAKELYARLTV